MLTQIEVNDKLLSDGLITAEEHSQLLVRNGKVWDDTQATFDVTERGDVKLRGSLVWLKGYALTPGVRNTESVYETQRAR